MAGSRSDSEAQSKAKSSDTKKLPKAGRLMDALDIVDPVKQLDKLEAEGSSSYHLILEAIKPFTDKRVFTKFLKEVDGTYDTYDVKQLKGSTLQEKCGVPRARSGFLSSTKPEWPVPSFEAFIADLFRICQHDLAPNITVYYDRETGKPITHGAFELRGFKTNHSAPLTAEKLFVGALEPAAIESRNLIAELRSLSTHLDGEPAAPVNSGLSGAVTSTISGLFGGLKRHAAALIDTNTSGNFKPFIDAIIANKYKLTIETVKTLITYVRCRKAHIGQDAKRDDEHKLLNSILSVAERVVAVLSAHKLAQEQRKAPTVQIKAPAEIKLDKSTIKVTQVKDDPMAEKMKMAKQMRDVDGFYFSTSGIPLTPEMILKFEKYSRRHPIKALLSMSDRGRDLTFHESDRSIIITANDLISYHTIKNVMKICVKSFHYQEGDLHNENLSTTEACVARIDHDMSWDTISHHFKDKNILEQLQRTPSEFTYKYTQELLDVFPINNNVYYWPTRESTFTASKLTLLKGLMANYERHLFRSEDSLVFQSLALDPIAIFNMYRTFLELMITPDNLIAALQKAQMKDELTYKNVDTERMHNLTEELLIKIKERKQELIRVAINNKAFCNFLKYYGDCALAIIKDDFLQDKKHHSDKSKKEKEGVDYSYAKDIADAIDIDQITREFDEIRSKISIPTWEMEEQEKDGVSETEVVVDKSVVQRSKGMK